MNRNIAVDPDVREAVLKCVQHYVDGARTGSADEMKKGFHPQATMFGYLEGHLMDRTMDPVYSWIDENGAVPELQAEVTDVMIFESIATVRLELNNWAGLQFTDIFSLLCIDGQWKIVHKIFHQH